MIVASLLASCGATPAAAPTTAPQPTSAPAAAPTAAAAQPTSAPAGKKFTIGISNPFISSEYRTQMIQELIDVNKQYMDKGITNELVIESADTDVAGQIQQLQNLINPGVVAAGQTLVIISGGKGIDLSAGAVVTLSAIITYSIANGRNETVIPALLAALVVGAAIGLANGIGVTFLKIAPLVMTLGMSGVVTGLILVITQGNVSGAIAF
jgi:branched-subunit amino acid transport system permease